ncbi:hypothetical protein Baya_9589 [Bagarius yarrelli]|uniref:Uncharacterized protein n=1 Tax=Bagarius yarrelli TaxID=175774 RepID=A0A556U8R5_BAGYA|nr:hypothetical protein Baya_9589 [Bagarius yarrelli]
MVPEESSQLKDTMANTPPSSPHPNSCFPAPFPCSALPSPPVSPARSGVVTFRSHATRHLPHLDAWRRHSWEPGAVAQGSPTNDTRSVSLEDLDMEEMALVLGGALGCRKARDMRRSVTGEGSLSSLTEEEAGIETQPQLCSPLEEQACQMYSCSVSAPSLCVLRRNPKVVCPSSTLLLLYLDCDLSTLRWGEKKEVRDEDKEEVPGNAFVRTFSFLYKMTSSRKTTSPSANAMP